VVAVVVEEIAEVVGGVGKAVRRGGAGLGIFQ
jgi:hypothetical protein